MSVGKYGYCGGAMVYAFFSLLKRPESLIPSRVLLLCFEIYVGSSDTKIGIV